MKSNSRHIVLLTVVAAVFFCLGVFLIRSSAAAVSVTSAHFTDNPGQSAPVEFRLVDTDAFEEIVGKYADLPEVSNDVREGMSLKLWKVDFLKDFFRNCTISDFRQVRGAVEGAYSLISSDFSAIPEENLTAFKSELCELTGASPASDDFHIIFGLSGHGVIEGIVAFNSGETCVLNQLYGNMLEETFDTFCRVLNSN